MLVVSYDSAKQALRVPIGLCNRALSVVGTRDVHGNGNPMGIPWEWDKIK